MSEYLEGTNWTIPDVALAIVAGIIVSVIGFAAAEAADLSETGVVAIALIAQSLGTVVVLVVLRSRRGVGSARQDFGLVLHPSDSWAIFLGIALEFGVGLVLLPLTVIMGEDIPEQALAGIVRESTGLSEQVLLFVGIVFIGPVIEEIVFRGMLLSRLRRSMSATWAVVASAAVFAGIHLLDPGTVLVVPGLFLVGLVLGYQANRRGDLSLPIFTHMGFNLTAAVLLLFGDQITEYLERIAEETEQAIALLRLLT